MVSEDRKIHDNLIKEEIKLFKAMQADRDLLHGLVLGILIGLLATIFFEEFVKERPENIRYFVEILILILFLFTLIPLIKRYRYKRDFYKSIKGAREEIYFNK